MERLVFAGILLYAHVALGVVPTNDALSQQLDDVYHVYNGTAATAYVATSNKFCAVGVAGYAHTAEKGVKFDVYDRLHMGSNTKSMTAALIGILLENNLVVGQGNKGWNATMADVYPELAVGTPYENVTLAALAAHYSGLPANAADYWQFYDPKVDMITQRQNIAAAAFASTPAATPDTTFIYSNWGLVTLGHVAEKSLNMAWEDGLLKFLIDPLGMRSSPAVYPFTAKGVFNWAHLSYNNANVPCDGDHPPKFTTDLNPYYACDNCPNLGPAGTYSGSILDTAKYYQWMIQCVNGEATQESVSLSQQGCAQLQTPYGPFDDSGDAFYGYGWIIVYVDAEKVVLNHKHIGALSKKPLQAGQKIKFLSHTGSNNHNIATVYVYPDYDLIYWAGTNSGRESDNEMIKYITNTVLPYADYISCA